MLIGERQREIINIVNKKGSVTVDELSKKFNVSQITIRSDLQLLYEEGKIIRTHGGALKITGAPYDLPIYVKETKHQEEKYLIGKAAVDLVQDGETIIIDSGSTTAELAKQIVKKQFKSLTVITNALNIAMVLSHQSNIQVVMLGGTLRKMSYSMVGPLAEETLSQFFTDRLFLGVDGFDTEYGLSTPDILEARLNRKMIEVSKKVVLLTDSSKFGRRSLSFIAKPEAIDVVVTDSNVPDQIVKSLKNSNVEMITVDVEGKWIERNGEYAKMDH
jgi:DeoR family transcriptional regulator, aga operon transcriptional repressor